MRSSRVAAIVIESVLDRRADAAQVGEREAGSRAEFSTAMFWITTLAWAIFGAWLFAAFLTARALARQKPLPRLNDATLKRADAPLVSIIVPCRNEAGRVLGASIGSMLAQDYGNFEIIAVDDRSTDETAEILRELAAADARLHVLEGEEPPPGWIGKPYALEQARRRARGEWILATDADMIFAPEAVREAVAHARKNGYDALSFVPRVDCLSFWERLFMPVFGWAVMMRLPLDRVNDPRRKEAIAAGGFFLIRREVLERVGGYNAVRAEVAEDLRMAELLKRTGARFRLEYAPHLVRTRMQTDLRGIWEGFSKNLFAGVGFRPLWGAFNVLLVYLLAVMPALLAGVVPTLIGVSGPWRAVWVASLGAWAVQTAIFVLVNRRSGVPAIYALAAPLGFALFGAILLNSTLRIASGRGVTWKGRKLYADIAPPRAD